jgi:hypothetical protein
MIEDRFADVAELVDALDLGSSAVRREGSSPFVRIFKRLLMFDCAVPLTLNK